MHLPDVVKSAVSFPGLRELLLAYICFGLHDIFVYIFSALVLQFWDYIRATSRFVEANTCSQRLYLLSHFKNQERKHPFKRAEPLPLSFCDADSGVI